MKIVLIALVIAAAVLVIVAAAALGVMFYASYVVLRAKEEGLPPIEQLRDDESQSYSAPLRPQPQT